MHYIVPKTEPVEEFREKLAADVAEVVAAMDTRRPAGVGFPLTTMETFYALSALGYEAERETYRYLQENGYMPAIPHGSGRGNPLAWRESDVLRYGCELEKRRKWLPGWHDEKKTAFERQQEIDAGREGAREWERHMQAPLGELVDEVVACEDRDTRDGIAVALFARLGSDVDADLAGEIRALVAAPTAVARMMKAADVRVKLNTIGGKHE